MCNSTTGFGAIHQLQAISEGPTHRVRTVTEQTLTSISKENRFFTDNFRGIQLILDFRILKDLE